MDPQEAALMQMQIKHNATDLQDYLKGLDSWEADMKQKDAQLSAHTSILKEVRRPCTHVPVQYDTSFTPGYSSG